MNVTDLSKIYTVDEAATWLGVTPAAIYFAIAKKKLEHQWILGRYVVSESALIEYNRKRLTGRRQRRTIQT